MTLDDVRRRVEEVRRAADEEYDSEKAHSLEDRVWWDVLLAISEDASTSDWARRMAREALQTRQIGFTRWCA